MTTYHRSGYGESNSTFALVTINGTEIAKKHGLTIHIHQSMLEHTTFELHCPSEAFSDKITYPLKNSIKLLGKEITIQFRRKGANESIFSGFITHVNYRKNNKYPFIVISGKSYSALLDSQKACRTYHNKTLKDILQEAFKEYTGSKIDFICQPNKTEIIPYTVSYNETLYEFIQRLAKRYGEYLFWNGSQLVFGRGNQKKIELKEGRDYLEYNIEVGVAPQHLIYENYNPQTAEVQSEQSKSASSHVNLLQEEAVNEAHKVYTKIPTSVYYDTLSEEQILIQEQKLTAHQKSLENLVQVTANTTHARLRLGDIAKMLAHIPEYGQQINSGTPIESYLIIQIDHMYTAKGYKNQFTGIPIEQQVAPYWDIQAYPQAEDQSAVVVDNNDPLKQNRIKVRFYWQKYNNETTPWIRLLQGHGGNDQGFHIIPEIGHEVQISFRGNNAEMPIVIGSLYNGKQLSGYHTSDNRFKALKTRDGEKLELEGLKNIILADVKGNKLHIDIENDILTLTALHTINLEAPFIHLKAEKDITLTAGNNIEQDSGHKTIMSSGDNTEISANKELDIYGKKKLIGYTDGRTEWGAKQQMHVYGGTSLITAKSRIDYKAPQIAKMPQPGAFLYSKEPEIVNLTWMDKDFTEKIYGFCYGEELGVLVKTRNYNEGDEISVNVKSENGEEILNGQAEMTLSGTVDDKGYAKLKVKTDEYDHTTNEENNTDNDSTEQDSQQQETDRLYKGKNYTPEEWKNFEQKQWEYYAKKNDIPLGKKEGDKKLPSSRFLDF